MGKNSIDEQIKSKLENRELMPQAEAWDRLNATLRKERRKGIMIWTGGVAAVLLVGGFVLQPAFTTSPSQTEERKEMQLTEVRTEEPAHSQASIFVEESDDKGEEVQLEIKKTSESPVQKINAGKQLEIQLKPLKVDLDSTTLQEVNLAVQESKTKETGWKEEVHPIKVEEKQQGDEVDVLLEMAQREISGQNEGTEANKDSNILPMAMLLEVETETIFYINREGENQNFFGFIREGWERTKNVITVKR